MGRRPCCDKVGLHRGAWSPEEDKLLIDHIQTYGEGQWRDLPAKAGLLRCGKSCRLRWVNYLRPGIKRGNFTTDENDTIIRLHSIHGSRWSLIAMELPGRTDNELKNHWNSYIRKAAENPDKLHTKNKKKSKKIKDVQTSKTQQPSTDVELVGTHISSSESFDKNESGTSSTCTSAFASLSPNESGASSSSTFDFGDTDFNLSWSFLEMDESSILEKLYLDYQSLIYNGDVNEENQIQFEF